MKANRLIATVLGACCAVILYAGCEEQAATPRQLDPRWFEQFQMPQAQPPVAQQPVAPPTQPTVTRSAKRPEPRMTFDKPVHDFGQVGLKTEKLCEFAFTNTGDGVLTIEGIKKSCGACTAFKLDKTDYAPGESGILKVKFYSDTQPGQITKDLTIYTNDPTNPHHVVTVTAKVLSMIEFEPKELCLLLKQDNAGCPKITLTSTDGKPFAISHFKSTDDRITVDYDPTVKAMKFVLEPKIDMARLANNLSGRIEIGLTHPECMAVTMGVRTVPKYNFRPLLARGAKPKKPQVKKVRIISNYDENFAIASTTSAKSAARVVAVRSIGNGYELDVEIIPPADTRMRILRETLFVTTGSGDRIAIPCNVYYAGVEPPKKTAKESEDCPHCGPRVIYRDGTINARDF